MTTTAQDDAIKTAMGIAKDIAAGKIDPADLERQAVAELTELMLTEPEPDSALWNLQAEVCRRTLARGDLPSTEISQFAAAVAARETNTLDPSSEPGRERSSLSEHLSPEIESAVAVVGEESTS